MWKVDQILHIVNSNVTYTRAMFILVHSKQGAYVYPSQATTTTYCMVILAEASCALALGRLESMRTCFVLGRVGNMMFCFPFSRD